MGWGGVGWDRVRWDEVGWGWVGWDTKDPLAFISGPTQRLSVVHVSKKQYGTG